MKVKKVFCSFFFICYNIFIFFSGIIGDLHLREKAGEENEKKYLAARDRIGNMKNEVNEQLSALFANLDIKPEDVLSDEEINQHLT